MARNSFPTSFNNFYLQQTFTHPYTPQGNGHIESFHAILSKELDGMHFDNLEELGTNS
ncbi:MAG: hypothetical protein KatS3mg031_3066 [Chitinophagales bacterium]|nr:MAG: hypothetical protein KatS3mg031_3066 [Chitinophagales bacterium]